MTQYHIYDLKGRYLQTLSEDEISRIASVREMGTIREFGSGIIETIKAEAIRTR